MKLQIINENITERLVSMYYDRLKSVLGEDFPNCELEQYNDFSGQDGLKGWFAKFSHKEYRELHTLIGTKSKENGIVISGLGLHSSWSSVKLKLSKLAQRWEKRIVKNKIENEKLQKRTKGALEFLDSKFSKDKIGNYILESRSIGNYTIYSKRYSIHRLIDLSTDSKWANSNRISINVPVTASITGSFDSDIVLHWDLGSIGYRGNFESFKEMAEFLNTYTNIEKTRELIESIIQKRDSWYSPIRNAPELTYYCHQIFTALMAGEMTPDRKFGVEPEVQKVTIFDRIVNYFGGGSSTKNSAIFNQKDSDYGHFVIRIVRNETPDDEQDKDMLKISVDLDHGGYTERYFAVDEVEEMISSNTLKDVIESMVEDRLLESVRYKNLSLVLENTDDIDQDIVNMAVEILQPILSKFPEITVRRGTQVTRNSGRHIIVLVRPTEPRELAIAYNGDLLVGTPGGRYKIADSEESLFNLVKNWAESKPRRPRQPRQPRQPRNIEQQDAQQHDTSRSRIEYTQEIDQSDYFPRTVHHLNRNVPGRTVSGGKPFTLAIHAKNVNFPPMIFQKSNLHNVNTDLPNLIGWIGGSYNKEKGIMYIDEVQSDLMQRTIEMTNQKRFNENIKKSMEETRIDINAARRELAALKRQEYATATERFKLVELIQNKIKEMNNLEQKSRRIYRLSDYSEYKSKVENTFKKWIQAFYHSAFNRARQLGLTDVYIISSDSIKTLWGRTNSDDDSIYSRAYDNMAKQLGAILTKSDLKISDRGQAHYWHIKLEDIPFSESINWSNGANKIRVVTEGVDREILTQWLEHAGITIDSIKGNFPDIDFDRLSMVVTKIEDGETKIIQDMDDLSPDSLHRALSFIQREDLDLPIEATPFELEELERDASILITAYKIVDGVPYGLAFYSLDSPNEPRYDADVYDADDNDFEYLSDADLFGDEDELEGMWERFGKD